MLWTRLSPHRDFHSLSLYLQCATRLCMLCLCNSLWVKSSIQSSYKIRELPVCEEAWHSIGINVNKEKYCTTRVEWKRKQPCSNNRGQVTRLLLLFNYYYHYMRLWLLLLHFIILYINYYYSYLSSFLLLLLLLLIISFFWWMNNNRVGCYEYFGIYRMADIENRKPALLDRASLPIPVRDTWSSSVVRVVLQRINISTWRRETSWTICAQTGCLWRASCA